MDFLEVIFRLLFFLSWFVFKLLISVMSGALATGQLTLRFRQRFGFDLDPPQSDTDNKLETLPRPLWGRINKTRRPTNMEGISKDFETVAVKSSAAVQLTLNHVDDIIQRLEKTKAKLQREEAKKQGVKAGQGSGLGGVGAKLRHKDKNKGDGDSGMDVDGEYEEEGGRSGAQEEQMQEEEEEEEIPIQSFVKASQTKITAAQKEWQVALSKFGKGVDKKWPSPLLPLFPRPPPSQSVPPLPSSIESQTVGGILYSPWNAPGTAHGSVRDIPPPWRDGNRNNNLRENAAASGGRRGPEMEGPATNVWASRSTPFLRKGASSANKENENVDDEAGLIPLPEPDPSLPFSSPSATRALHSTISSHFLRKGQFALARTWNRECGISGPTGTGTNSDSIESVGGGMVDLEEWRIFSECHRILSEVDKGEMRGVLRWVNEEKSRRRERRKLGVSGEWWGHDENDNHNKGKGKAEGEQEGEGKDRSGFGGDGEKMIEENEGDDDWGRQLEFLVHKARWIKMVLEAVLAPYRRVAEVSADGKISEEDLRGMGLEELLRKAEELGLRAPSTALALKSSTPPAKHSKKKSHSSSSLPPIPPSSQSLIASLSYLRSHFPRFSQSSKSHLHEIMRLSNSITYATSLDRLLMSPYADLFEPYLGSLVSEMGIFSSSSSSSSSSPSNQLPLLAAALIRSIFPTSSSTPPSSSSCSPESQLKSLFTTEFCASLGLSKYLPLTVVNEVGGGGAIGRILKLQQFVKARKAEWSSHDELPGPIPIPSAYRFHSVFTCPVIKGQSTEENPPMMLPCGHVVARESLAQLAKGSSRTLKCPYCPVSSTLAQAVQLYF